MYHTNRLDNSYNDRIIAHSSQPVTVLTRSLKHDIEGSLDYLTLDHEALMAQ